MKPGWPQTHKTSACLLSLPPSFRVKSTRKSEGPHQLREFKTTFQMERIRPRTLSLRNPATDISGYGMFSKVQRLRTLSRKLGTPGKTERHSMLRSGLPSLNPVWCLRIESPCTLQQEAADTVSGHSTPCRSHTVLKTPPGQKGFSPTYRWGHCLDHDTNGP